MDEHALPGGTDRVELYELGGACGEQQCVSGDDFTSECMHRSKSIRWDSAACILAEFHRQRTVAKRCINGIVVVSQVSNVRGK